MPMGRVRKFFHRGGLQGENQFIFPVPGQVNAWRKANHKMGWNIEQKELDEIGPPPLLNDSDREGGYLGVGLFYGFGDDGSGNADALLSGKLAWEYAMKRYKRKTWQCEYTHIDEPDYKDYIRLRPDAPARPKGFYYAKLQLGGKFQTHTVSQVRKELTGDTGCGPEGFQLLAITQTHFQKMMEEKNIPFMALAD